MFRLQGGKIEKGLARMDAYTGFAYVYDEYMDNIPYEEWAKYLIEILKEFGVTAPGDVADLGCGTGTVTRILDKAGFECVGIDMSEDMLSIAAEKTYENEQEIVYSEQDMRDFALPFEVDACVSIGDSMNYITSVEDLQSVFECVNENLADDGVFVFDLKTIHFFKDVLSDNTYAQNRDDSAFIWENEYDMENRNNIYNLAVFVLGEDGSFTRYEETHCQHGFEIDEVLTAAKNAGLTQAAVYDAFTHNAPNEESERLYFIFKK
jgi:SAM-dependent methyltransferase